MRKVLFIGPVAEKYSVIGGCVAKNKILKEYLETCDIKLTTIDTYWERKNIIYTFYHKSFYNFILLIRLVIFSFYADDIIMGDHLYHIINIFGKLGVLNKLTLFGIGGRVPALLKKNLDLCRVKEIKIIYVESKAMAFQFFKEGVYNVQYLPNFKKLEKNDKKQSDIEKETLKVFYIGKICKEKGIDTLIHALSSINNSSKNIKFRLFLYGQLDVQLDSSLKELIKQYSWILCKGAIDLIHNSSCYDELADYDIFVFPTRWGGKDSPEL